ncbi:hypothetical protein Tco_1495347, partial [Tanacetum coccineum]
GSGDGVDILSKVVDEQQQTRSGEDEEHDSDDDNDDNNDEDDDQENGSQRTESDDEGDNFFHPNLSTCIADDQEKEKEEEKADDDDDDVNSYQKVSTPPEYELTEEDVNQEDDDTMGEDQEDEEDEELYSDLNINLNRRDVEMTDAQINQETGEVHVTLTTEPPVVQQQSSLVSSDLVSKFINPSPDTEEAQSENDEFLKLIDSNIKNIIKDQVKAQVSKIMPKVQKNDDVSPVREATDVDERLWNPSGSRTPDREWNQTKMVDDRPPQ